MAQTSSAVSVGERQPYNGLFLVRPEQDAVSTFTQERRHGARVRGIAQETEPNMLLLAAGAMLLPAAWAADKLLHQLFHHL